jgi:hypothetical protein
VIRLPEAPAGRSVLPSGGLAGRIVYALSLAGSGGSLDQTLSPGQTQVVFNLVPGDWTVTVMALLEGLTIGSGSARVRVTGRPGQNLSIGLDFYDEVYDELDFDTDGNPATPVIIDDVFSVRDTPSWEAALAAISDGGDNKNYVINVSGNVSGVTGGTVASSFGGVTGVTVSLRGGGGLALGSNGSLINIGANQTLVLRDVTLRGKANNENSPLVLVDGGELVMNYGSKVTGNGVTTSGGTPLTLAGGILVKNAGTFVMNGGEISGNSYTTHAHDWHGAGGVTTLDASPFTMNGGIIRNNTFSTTWNTQSAGGVRTGLGLFTLTGGEIRDNTGSYTGGAQAAIAGGVMCSEMRMSGGIISGNSASNTAARGGTGGGILVSTKPLLISGGEISNNSATGARAGGGIRVLGADRNGVLQKLSTGGVIWGADAAPALQNKVNGSSSAVSYGGWDNEDAKARANTANLADTMDSALTGSAGGWD